MPYEVVLPAKTFLRMLSSIDIKEEPVDNEIRIENNDLRMLYVHPAMLPYTIVSTTSSMTISIPSCYISINNCDYILGTTIPTNKDLPSALRFTMEANTLFRVKNMPKKLKEKTDMEIIPHYDGNNHFILVTFNEGTPVRNYKVDNGTTVIIGEEVILKNKSSGKLYLERHGSMYVVAVPKQEQKQDPIPVNTVPVSVNPISTSATEQSVTEQKAVC